MTKVLLALACLSVAIFVVTLLHFGPTTHGTPPWAYLPGRCTVATSQFAVASIRVVDAPRITFSGWGSERYCARVEQTWQGRRVGNPTEEVSSCKWTYDDEVTAFVWSPQGYPDALVQIERVCSNLRSLRP